MNALKNFDPPGEVTMVQCTPSTSTFTSPWSISSAHTMPKPSAKADPKDGDEPEIDIIDGATILSFKSFEAMSQFTQREECIQKEAQRKKSISERKRKNEIRSGLLDESKSKSRLSLDFALKDINYKSSSKSAFVSDLLDDYLNQTKEDHNGKRSCNPEYFGAPPEESKIYSPGILNMDNVKKSFAVLPAVSKSINSSKPEVKSKPKCSFKRSHDQAVNKSPKIPKGKMIRSKHLVSSDNKETVFEELMASTFADIEARKNRGLRSLEMDEPYVRFAFETFRTPTKDSSQPALEEDDISDVARMISRHSKRDIRLPARYHNSNIMIGNEWVTPTADVISEKKGRKRLIEEQKRLIKSVQVNHQSPKKIVDQSTFKRLLKEHRTNHKSQNGELQQPIVKIDKTESATTTVPVASPRNDKSVMGGQLKISILELKELYRQLYFENVPERRLYHQKKGTKPRVNKPQVVDEAHKVIAALEEHDRRLNYIDKLMSTWKQKLELCLKVVTKEVEPEPTPDGKNVVAVVTDVLHAYQRSVCYQLQEALGKMTKQSDSNQVATKVIDITSPRSITRAIVNKDNRESLTRQLQVNGCGQRIIKTAANIVASETQVPKIDGKKRIRSEPAKAAKQESILLARPPHANIIRITPELYAPPPKIIRLSGPQFNIKSSANGFISVTPASFKTTSNGPVVTLDPKGSLPNAFAIKLSGPPPTSPSGQRFTTFRKKEGNLIPVTLPHNPAITAQETSEKLTIK